MYVKTSLSADAMNTLVLSSLSLTGREVFKELKKIGEGNFSRVYHVTNRMDGTDYAVKRSKTEVSDETLKRQWFQVGL